MDSTRARGEELESLSVFRLGPKLLMPDMEVPLVSRIARYRSPLESFTLFDIFPAVLAKHDGLLSKKIRTQEEGMRLSSLPRYDAASI